MEKGFIRAVLKAAREAGLSKDERGELVRRGDDIVNDVIDFSHPENSQWNQHISGTPQLFKFTEEGVEAGRNGEMLKNIVSVLRVYGSKVERGRRVELMPEERRLVSLAVKYFEDWMYRGVFLAVPEKLEGRTAEFFGGSAFVVNQLAKVKEVANNGLVPGSENLVASFDNEHLYRLIDETLRFAEEYMSEEKVRERVNVEREKLASADQELGKLEDKKKPYDEGIARVGQEVRSEYGGWCKSMKELAQIDGGARQGDESEYFRDFFLGAVDRLEEGYWGAHSYRQTQRHLVDAVVTSTTWGDHQSFLDIFRAELEKLLKDRVNSRRGDETEEDLPSLPTLAQFDGYARKLSALLKQKEATREEKKEGAKPGVQKVSGLGALGSLRGTITTVDPAIKVLQLLFDKKAFLDKKERVQALVKDRGSLVDPKKYSEIQVKQEHQKRLYEKTLTMAQGRNKILATLNTSVESARKQLPLARAGDLYFLKNLLIAAAEQDKNDAYFEDYCFSPDALVPHTTKHDATFDFRSSYRDVHGYGHQSGLSGDYMSVHFDPAHMPLAQFVVEYMRVKREEGQ